MIPLTSDRGSCTHPFKASLESIELALYGALQKMPHVQIDILLLVGVCDRLAGPFNFQIDGLQALIEVSFLFNLQDAKPSLSSLSPEP